MELNNLTNEELNNLKIRTENDIAKYDNLQMAMKILLNSAYGGIGNQYFRFFDLRIAEAITLSGQLSIRWIADRLNNFLNDMLKTDNVDYVIAIDTDSNYIRFSEVVEKAFSGRSKEEIVNALDGFCRDVMEPFIDKQYQELGEYMNAYAQKMVMAREVIADRGIWTAKKRYILNVWDSEGVRYSEPKMKVMGIEAIKSDTPEICRKKMKACFKIIMEGSNEDLIKFIDEFYREYKKLPAEDIGTPKGCNNLAKYSSETTVFKKKCPKQVKGALFYNLLLKKHDVEKDYDVIAEGDKIKFVDLKRKNPLHQNAISFPVVLPPEFDLHRYIDYDAMFERTFLVPMLAILDEIAWKAKETRTLEAFI